MKKKFRQKDKNTEYSGNREEKVLENWCELN